MTPLVLRLYGMCGLLIAAIWAWGIFRSDGWFSFVCFGVMAFALYIAWQYFEEAKRR